MTTGPKVSSCQMSIERSMFDSTVGSTKLSQALPPRSTRAPRATASSISAFTRCACRVLTIGPMVFDLSFTWPVFSRAARLRKRSMKGS
jgi:hypothetical protein